MSKNPEKMKINGTTAVPVAFIPVVAKAVLSSGRTVARLDLVAFAWCFLKVIVEFKSNKSKMQRQQISTKKVQANHCGGKCGEWKS